MSRVCVQDPQFQEVESRVPPPSAEGNHFLMREGTVGRSPCQSHVTVFLLLGWTYSCHLAEGEKQLCWMVPLPCFLLSEAGSAMHRSYEVTLTRDNLTPAQMV